jgi:hypothetical protein
MGYLDEMNWAQQTSSTEAPSFDFSQIQPNSGFETGFNFNWDWSGLGAYYSDENALQREIDNAVLGAGLTEFANYPELQDPNFYAALFAGDPAAIARDLEIAAAIQTAQDEIRQYYGIQTVVVTPAPITSTPPTPSPAVPITPPVPPVKTAPIDTILFDDDTLPVQVMADLIFENIGGQELINIARNDTINGQNVVYQPIVNLSSIQQEYNPNNIVSLQGTSNFYFKNFSIKLENKIPQEGDGPNQEYVYISPETGELIIEFINLDIDEQIELEIITGGTIYEAEFNE